MAANFLELTADFCEHIKTPVPELVPGEDGAVGFSLLLKDVAVTIGHETRQFSAHYFVQVEFGVVPLGHEERVFRELLEANAALMQPDAPAFALHPSGGTVLLQCCCPLEPATGETLWRAIMASVNVAIQWRETGALALPSHAALSALFV